jgi:hypothetical protein
MSLNQLSGEQIIGNRKSFDSISEDYSTDLCRLVYTFVKDMDISKYIVQEMFIPFLETRENIKINIFIRAYLYTSVKIRNYINFNPTYGNPHSIMVSFVISNYAIISAFAHLQIFKFSYLHIFFYFSVSSNSFLYLILILSILSL